MLVRGSGAASLAALVVLVAAAHAQKQLTIETLTSTERHPYLVYLQVGRNFSTADDADGCTGVLLSARMVLSGAHCYGEHPEKLDPGDVTVLAGQVNRTEVSAGQTRRGKLLFVHPDMSGGLDAVNPYPDVAVLELEEAVELGPYVMAATLLRSSEDMPDSCEAVGWWFRRDEDGNVFHGHLAASSPARALSYSRCLNSYFGVVEHSTQFCLVVPHNTSVLGYRGNPVLCDGHLLGLRYLRSYIREDKDRQRVDVAVRLSVLDSWLDKVTHGGVRWTGSGPEARSHSPGQPATVQLLLLLLMFLTTTGVARCRCC